MTMEFLADGADECPLIRLYAFSLDEATRLRELFLRLATGTLESIDLHEQDFITSVNECRLSLLVDRRNRGIDLTPNLDFECVATKASWADMAALSEAFTGVTNEGTYQWLNDAGKVSLLLSPSGRW